MRVVNLIRNPLLFNNDIWKQPDKVKSDVFFRKN